MVSIETALKGEILTRPLATLQTFRTEYLKVMKESVILLRNSIRGRTPIGATGRLYKSIGYTVEDLTPLTSYSIPTGPIEIRGHVFSSSKLPVFLGIFREPIYMACTYQRAVEGGTRPHWPPWSDIHGWVQQVLGPFDRAALSRTAFFVARKISQRGTSPRYMFRDSFQEFKSQGILEKKVGEATERAIKYASADTPWWAK